MKFVFEHFWALGFVVLFANAIYLHFRFRSKYEEFPERKKGYQQIILWYSCFCIGALAIFAVGDLIFDDNFLDKKHSLMQYVLYSYGIAWSVLCLIWIYFLNGVDFLEKHPGLVRVRIFSDYREITDRFWLKFIFTAFPVGGIVMAIIRMIV